MDEPKGDTLHSDVNPWIMSAYIFYSSLLVMKMFLTGFLVSLKRSSLKIVGNPEDARFFSKDLKEVKINTNHPELTRVQRMHANDLENIIPFLLIGFFYMMTMPSGYKFAVWHFRIFFAARVMTTICHYFQLQPFRSIFYGAGMSICFSLLAQIFIKAGPNFYKYL